MWKFTEVLGCLLVALSASCGPADGPQGTVPKPTDSVGSGSSSCPKATVAVTPVPAESFVPGSYAGRSFLVPQNHLGEDILVPEGGEVRSPAAGTVVFYGPASGYGELLAVVEHDLVVPITVRNGTGDYSTVSSFLSIAGHLRKSRDRGGEPLAFKVGDCVTVGQTIGYVNDANHNGDGGVHVHSGARLMSDVEVKSRDGIAPYRGYDTADGKWKGDYASMHETLSAISAAPTWHPDGTLIQVAGRPEIWHLEYGRRRYVPSEQVFNEARYYTGGSTSVWNRVVTVTETELSCYEAGLDVSVVQTARVISCQDGFYLAPATQYARYRIMSQPGSAEYVELLKSWGFASVDPISGDSGCSLGIGPWRLNLRDGTLVKEVGKSDVYAVADGIAWPIVSWDTFLALGYKQSNIQVVPAGSLKDLVMSVSGEVIDSSYVSRCADAMAMWCTDQMCQASIGGGSGATDPAPDGAGGSSGAPGAGGAGGNGGSSSGGSGGGQSSSGGDGGSSSTGGSSGAGGAACVPKPEVCNDQDDDCDGYSDNGFDFLWDSGHCSSCYISCDRPNTQFGCVNGVCEWWGCQPGYANANGNWSDGCESLACVPTVETCNGQDDDCDGAIDENGVCDPPDAGVFETGPEAGPDVGSGGSSQDAGAPDGPGPEPGAGHTVRVVYPATQCLNNDMLNWTKDCPGGSFDKTWTGVTNGLKRMNYQVNGQWLCGETYPGQVVTPYGLPQITVDGANVQAFAIHDWRMNWGCNIMVCIGGPCELCCNGVDDDGDGFVDTADGDCQDAIACFP